MPRSSYNKILSGLFTKGSQTAVDIHQFQQGKMMSLQFAGCSIAWVAVRLDVVLHVVSLTNCRQGRVMCVCKGFSEFGCVPPAMHSLWCSKPNVVLWFWCKIARFSVGTRQFRFCLKNSRTLTLPGSYPIPWKNLYPLLLTIKTDLPR